MTTTPGPVPDLSSYDFIVLNTSAGKDSQAMIDHVTQLAVEAGVADRIVAVHCDLGRVEWEGTRELAERQVAHYGHRFEVVSRDRDLLHQIEFERQKFPDSARRYCTSDQKTSQVTKLFTKLVAERRNAAGWVRNPDGTYTKRQVRILNCLGLRAQESPVRAKRPAFEVDKASNGKRHIDRWLPIHQWKVEEVWARIEASGVEHHRAYDLGIPRLSCVFCVFASKEALILAAQHNPELAEEYVRVELTIGHTFRKDLTIASVVEEAQTRTITSVSDWAA